MTDDIVELNMIQLAEPVGKLALPADRQISSFSPKLDVPYEMADDFGNWCGWVLKCNAVVLSEDQRSRLSDLLALLRSISGEQHAELWTDDALRHDPTWEEVRRKAREIMTLFGWTMER